MSRYEDEGYETHNNMNRQRDLVLSTNEFCFLQSKTNGAIKTYTGPITMTISAQESLVVFNPKTKRFEETQDFEKARQLFVSAPENWYVVLKNPSYDNSHPDVAKAVNSPDLKIGCKINIAGPTSFSLYPGQMARTIQGHRLRSNQYLLARVYDAAAAEAEYNTATVIDAEGQEVENGVEHYHAGQLLVIKGTEISFYIPPTGIEVVAVEGAKNTYIRDAVTLERLEYAILKDEDGEKRYVHGPAVVFPEPTETFVETDKGGTIFRALELSPISGIYVKVIAEYDEKGIHYNVGDELFITGDDQMIYYPRPEHAVIQYDGKYMHHAIAIPEGEGRYVMNRLTGEISTVYGPAMYLPDPRTEVVVKRKLTDKECQLFYPNNIDVLVYNQGLSEKATEKAARKGLTETSLDNMTAFACNDQASTLAIFEANANISRGTSYTKPRTITLDTKYEGVVAIDVWTGYAINVVSKTGNREVVVGPTTRLLDYNETLECMQLSTGKPKTTDKIYETAYLRIENNKISDIIEAQTADFVNVRIKVSYCVNFLEDYMDRWFSVENYVKYLCDRQRSLLKREIKKYTIEEFYNNSTDIVRKVALAISESENKEDSVIQSGRLFSENGMLVYDVEVLTVEVDAKVADIFEQHQQEMIEKTLELSNATQKMETTKKLAEYAKQENQIEYDNKTYALNLQKTYEENKLAAETELAAKQRAEQKAIEEAKADLQAVLDSIQAAELARGKARENLQIENQKAQADIEAAREAAYAKTIANIMASISPDLIAAMTSQSNAEMLATVSDSVGPYAIANGESISETVNRLMRGTSLEGIIDNVTKNKIEG